MFAGLSWFSAVLWTAATAGALVLLHLLRVRPRQVRVVTAMFWEMETQRTRARHFLYRFRHLLTFLLLLLICWLLIGALWAPRLNGRLEHAQARVVVLDAGVSMDTRDGESGATRMARACRQVLDLAQGGNTAIVVADPYPRLLHRFGDLPNILKRNLDALVVAPYPSERVAAMAVAESLAQERESCSLIMVTDRPWADAKSPSDRAGDWQIIRIGVPADNVGVLTAQYETDPDNPFMGRLSWRIGYQGQGPRSVQVEVRDRNGNVLNQQEAVLEPDTEQAMCFAPLEANGAIVTIAVVGDDAFVHDDTLTMMLPRRGPIRVAFAGDVPYCLEAAVRAHPAVRVVGADQKEDVLVVGAEPPFETPAIAIVSDAATSTDMHVVGAVTDHWLMRDLDFEMSACSGSLGELPAAAAPLLHTDDKSVLAAWQVAPTGCLWLDRAMLESNATVWKTPAFAVMIHRALEALAGWRGAPAVIAAETVQQHRPHTEQMVYPALIKPVVTGNGVVAANDSNAAGDNQAHVTASVGRKIHQWQMLLVAALAIMVFEGVLYLRGRIS